MNSVAVCKRLSAYEEARRFSTQVRSSMMSRIEQYVPARFRELIITEVKYIIYEEDSMLRFNSYARSSIVYEQIVVRLILDEVKRLTRFPNWVLRSISEFGTHIEEPEFQEYAEELGGEDRTEGLGFYYVFEKVLDAIRKYLEVEGNEISIDADGTVHFTKDKDGFLSELLYMGTEYYACMDGAVSDSLTITTVAESMLVNIHGLCRSEEDARMLVWYAARQVLAKKEIAEQSVAHQLKKVEEASASIPSGAMGSQEGAVVISRITGGCDLVKHIYEDEPVTDEVRKKLADVSEEEMQIDQNGQETSVVSGSRT